MRGVVAILAIFLIAGCTTQTSSRFDHAEIDVKTPVQYTPTGIDGYVQSNQDMCLSGNKVILMLFGKEGNVWSDEALRTTMESLNTYSGKIFFEDWTGSNVPSDREQLFLQFNPTRTYPTIIVGCEYLKVGSGGNHDDNVRYLKQILDLAVNK